MIRHTAVPYRVHHAHQVVYVNADSYAALGAPTQHAELIRVKGWMVVNAPRPLPAAWPGPDGACVGVTWQGPPAHGIFYAAGDPAANHGQLQVVWSQLDAWEVVLVDNAWVQAQIAHELAARGMRLADYLAAGMDLAEVAALRGYPWRVATPAGSYARAETTSDERG